MTPREFARNLNDLSAGTMIEDMEMLHAGEGRARCRMEFKPRLRQLTGLFHAGAILGLADTTATAAAMWELNPTGESRPELFPLSIQVSANLIRNTDHGALTAEAELIHRGKSTMVADVRVTDDQSRLIARLTATLMVPRVSARERTAAG
jgi:1,4-dihydroxy-2-naphthoyl-CoA hydrolase